MKKIFKRSIAILLCFTMIFNYSFLVLADENVESSEPEAIFTETIENTEVVVESDSETENKEEIEEESNGEVLDEGLEEIDEPEEEQKEENDELEEELNEELEEKSEEEPKKVDISSPSELVDEENEEMEDTVEEPEEEPEKEPEKESEKEPEEESEKESKEELEKEPKKEPEKKLEKEPKKELAKKPEKELEIEDIEYVSPSDAEEVEECLEEEKIDNIASTSDVDEIIDDIGSATPSKVEESTSDELLYGDSNIKFSSGMKTEIPFDPKTWMSKLPNNYPITELTVPASHDSGTYNIKFYGLDLLKMEIYKMINDQLGVSIGEDVYNFLRENFSLMTKLLEKMATWAIDTIQQCSGQCQTDSITEQLNKGIRALDLRFRYEDGEFYIVHGCESEGLIGILTTCNCYDKNNNRLTLDMCFSEIRDFLNEHKKEVVFISVQQEGGDYNREIEKKIIQLEFNYGIEFHFAKRKYSESVINELYPTTPNNKNINAKASSTMDRGIHVLGQFRQKAVDITDAVEDWENHWSDTVTMKKNHLKDAVKDHSLLGMAQSNVMVKIYKKNDPHKECSFPFSIKLVRIPVIRIPLYVTIDFHAEKLIITPKLQAAKVKPHLMNLIKEYTNKGKSSDKALGLIRLDFPTANECAIIANVNTKNTYFPATGELDTSDYCFVYDGLADYETEVEEFLEEAEREVEELSVYDYRFYIDNNNSGGGGSSGSSGGTPRYDSEGNILGPSGKQSYIYDGTNPPNLTGNINVSSWNYATGIPQVNSIKYVQNIDSFVRADNIPVVTEWVGVTTNDIGKVMWYRTDATGKILKNQFIQIGTNIYYLDNNGIMATGQYTINGKVYNFETAVGAIEGRFLY